MSEIEKIERYIKRTKMKRASHAMGVNEIESIYQKMQAELKRLPTLKKACIPSMSTANPIKSSGE